MLDEAFEALKTYDWGTDPKVLAPIEEAVVTSHGNADARKDLETRLAAVLTSGVSRDAKDYACRKLMLIGTAQSVPTLAGLLTDNDLSHMARYALERIPAAEAGQALRDALSKVSGPLQVGVIGSLGARHDAEATAPIAALLNNADPSIARAAAIALGDIGTAEAAKALADAKPSAPGAAQVAADATLACAEDLLAAGKKAEALAVYKSLAGENQPKNVRLAATRGMLACAGK
ncbi:MAG TPA: HEAT repeat domain-containing protein [Pirellulales bacterium]|nr:HEAT repeat domain-containing protein [Pirellulales bacterium]